MDYKRINDSLDLDSSQFNVYEQFAAVIEAGRLAEGEGATSFEFQSIIDELLKVEHLIQNLKILADGARRLVKPVSDRLYDLVLTAELTLELWAKTISGYLHGPELAAKVLAKLVDMHAVITTTWARALDVNVNYERPSLIPARYPTCCGRSPKHYLPLKGWRLS